MGIDPMTLAVTGRLQLGDAITNGVAATEDGRQIYVPTSLNEVFCVGRV